MSKRKGCSITSGEDLKILEGVQRGGRKMVQKLESKFYNVRLERLLLFGFLKTNQGAASAVSAGTYGWRRDCW